MKFTGCNGREADLSNTLRGTRSAFLITNGPKALDAIDEKQLYLPGIFKMGVNNGPARIRPNAWTCVDPADRFLKSVWFDPTIMKFIPRGFCTKTIWDTYYWFPLDRGMKDCPNLYQYQRNGNFDPETFFTAKSLNWGLDKSREYICPETGTVVKGVRSCMLVAFRLLIELGAKTIFLVGCDFRMDPEKPYAFDEEKSVGGCKSNNRSYQGLNIFFNSLRPELEKRGVKVYNTFKESGLHSFPYIEFDRAVELALTDVGDPTKEHTRGMYSVRKTQKEMTEKVKESRKTSGHYYPKNPIDLSKYLTFEEIDVMLPTGELEKIEDQEIDDDVSVFQRLDPQTLWEVRNELISLYPELEARAEAVEKRGRRSRGCRGCAMQKQLRKFVTALKEEIRKDRRPILSVYTVNDEICNNECVKIGDLK